MSKDKYFLNAYKYIKVLCMFLSIIFFTLVFVGYANFAYVFLEDLLQTIFCGALLLASNFSFRWIIHEFIRKLLNKTVAEFKESLLAYWIVTLFDIAVFIFALILFAFIWGVHPQIIQDVLNAIFIEGIEIGETSIAVFTILEAFVLLAVILLLTKLIILILNKRVLPYTRLDSGAKDAITITCKYIGVLIAIIMAVLALGFSSTSIAFIASAFMFGLSFALRDIVGNFLSGIIMMIERPIKIGDWVDVDKECGVVKQIRLRTTIVETFNRKTLLIPNGQFITKTISNDMYTPISRVVIPVECSYDDDPEQVKKILLDISNNEEKVMLDPAPSVLFKNFGDSGLLFLLRIFCPTNIKTGLESNLRFKIFEEFKRNSIEIPYPKQDVYVKELTAKSSTEQH